MPKPLAVTVRPLPPRPIPRGLFVAAFAFAAALLTEIKRPPRIGAPTIARIERRDRAIGRIVRTLGRAIISAGRAMEAAAERGAAWVAPALGKAPLDPRVRVVVACQRFTDLIGKPAPGAAPASERDQGAPWVEFRPEPPRISIMWRGTLIAGERGSAGRPIAFSRQIDAEAFAQAIKAAAAALDAAGYRTSGLIDVRAHRTSKDQADKFEGLVATIGLARERPAWMTQPQRSNARTL